jgi:hypothetical protein
MQVARHAFFFGLAAASLTACGPQIPPAGNYATVFGRVTDSVTGQAIPNAQVIVNVVYTATTDANGSFRIPNVPTGGWDYAVQASGYAPVQSDQPAPLAPGEQRDASLVLVRQ